MACQITCYINGCKKLVSEGPNHAVRNHTGGRVCQWHPVCRSVLHVQIVKEQDGVLGLVTQLSCPLLTLRVNYRPALTCLNGKCARLLLLTLRVNERANCCFFHSVTMLIVHRER